MLLTIAQRGVGFLRTAIFCSLLSEQELGQWSLVFSFVMLCGPLTLMGITGSFGRYVEHYLQQGLVRQFFRRTAVAIGVLTAVMLVAIWVAQDWVSWALFGSAENRDLLVPASITLVTTITYYYFHEVTIALRRIKVASLMELIASWVFASVAVLTLWFTDLGSFGVIIGFAVGNLCGAAYSASIFLRSWKKLPQSEKAFPHLSLWRKLAPFALGLWVVNIVSNTFDMVDRYMIVHFSGLQAESAQSLVGQYFSSMAIPLLMVGISTTLRHMVMPYLSKDWEQGRFKAVSDRVNLSVKLHGTLLCFGSVCIVIVAPLLFNTVFQGKYDEGLGVLPYTVAFCFWRGISEMVYNYLYCAERTRLMCVSLVASLMANIVFNALLLPIWGLTGAAIATAIGTVLNLAIVLIFSVQLKLQLNRGVLMVLLFPLLLPFGPIISMVGLAVLLLAALKTEWLLTSNERNQFDEVLRGYLAKFLPERWLPTPTVADARSFI